MYSRSLGYLKHFVYGGLALNFVSTVTLCFTYRAYEARVTH